MNPIHHTLSKMVLAGLSLSLFACDPEEDIDDSGTNLEAKAEDLNLAYDHGDEHGIEVKPFAVLELDNGRRVSFVSIDEEAGDILVGESSMNPEDKPLYVLSGRSPLEMYWELTAANDAVPEVLYRNYETNFGDVAEFMDAATPRGAGLVTEIAAPPPPPQEAKWWTESCGTSGTAYDFATCLFYWTLADDVIDWGGRFDNDVAYSIARDTSDTSRLVRLYYSTAVGTTCSHTAYYTLDTGAWAVEEYIGSANRSWWATIDGGCDQCYEFGSVFLYNATQTGTCTTPPS